ncbi:glycosyltransferase [Terrabacter sp. NPDC000476]|uniref:glycosyltransferase n=1 Tax=Terrabacter sp. NPDC000476 TaxID=3154258 RepID=UPI0033276730
MLPVLQWAQEHGEVGGVRTSHAQLTAILRAEGVQVDYVDTGSARRAAAMLPRLRHRAMHLLHLTRLWRAMLLAPLFALLRGRTVLVLHSGSTSGQVARMPWWRRRLLVLALYAYDEIWAVNDEIGAILPEALRARVTVVTPFDSSAAPVPSAIEREPHALALATNAGLAHYNADVGVEVTRRVRERWPDATLTVLAYGNDTPEVEALRRTATSEPWLTVEFDASPAEVSAVLARVGTFLRPTSWDGDSVIVREAQAAGATVVASDTAPRPQGVVLAPLDASSLAAAVVDGGVVSDGNGLAQTTLADAVRAAGRAAGHAPGRAAGHAPGRG